MIGLINQEDQIKCLQSEKKSLEVTLSCTTEISTQTLKKMLKNLIKNVKMWNNYVITQKMKWKNWKKIWRVKILEWKMNYYAK